MKKYGLLLAFGCLISHNLLAMTYPLPPNGDTLVGEDYAVKASHSDTLSDIARRTDLGFDAIINANPSVDAWLPKDGSIVMIPHRTLLPAAPHEGIVVNTAEMRLYYYPPHNSDEAAMVEVFPISIGRRDWNTPLVTTTVIGKTQNPVWRPPPSIKEEHAREGDALPDVVAAGPNNPLGLHALYLGASSYLIHGTNKEYGIGMQVTHGCIRMYPEDIEHLYNAVSIGTTVRIVNQPYKTGWFNDVLYLEIHPRLEGATTEQQQDKTILANLIQSALGDYPNYKVNWTVLETARIEANGQPVAIGPIRQEPVMDDFGFGSSLTH